MTWILPILASFVHMIWRWDDGAGVQVHSTVTLKILCNPECFRQLELKSLELKHMAINESFIVFKCVKS